MQDFSAFHFIVVTDFGALEIVLNNEPYILCLLPYHMERAIF